MEIISRANFYLVLLVFIGGKQFKIKIVNFSVGNLRNLHVVINKIINLEKQEVALGNQNVRAVCLRDNELEFKFLFCFLFFFLKPCYFRTKYKLCFIFMTKARK